MVLLLTAFGVFGLWSGCNAVLLADLSGALGLSPGPLGAALFAGAASSIAAMASLGWAADRLGRKAFLVGALCLFGIGIAGLALVAGFWALLAVVVLVFSAGGLYDVGINAAAVDLEGLSRRRLMSFLHAAYSGGAVIGAVGSGALLAAGLGYRLVYLSFLLPLVVVALAVAAARFPGPAYAGGSSRGDGGPGTDAGGPTSAAPSCWWRPSRGWACSPKGRWALGRASTCAGPWGCRRSSAVRGWRSSSRRWP